MCRRNQTRRYAFPAQAGMTLIELIIACSILLVLATAAMPVARFTVMRQKESELRRSLREIRDAIDRYKDAADRNLIRVAAGTEEIDREERDVRALVMHGGEDRPASTGRAPPPKLQARGRQSRDNDKKKRIG